MSKRDSTIDSPPVEIRDVGDVLVITMRLPSKLWRAGPDSIRAEFFAYYHAALAVARKRIATEPAGSDGRAS